MRTDHRWSRRGCDAALRWSSILGGRHTTAVAILLVIGAKSFAAEGNSIRGQHVFGACAACHALQPDQNMTGPSLADLWNRKAGSLPTFTRYSPALVSANIIWNDKTLDEWIADPQHLVPGNQMTFAGIKDARQRADLLAFLKHATKPTAVAQGGAAGAMMGGGLPNLKNPAAGSQVQAISHCKDTYTITTADGQTRKFWERNLRIKTDASADGPEKNAPALVGAGMMGDRADVIFADPSEISAHIAPKC